MFKGLSKIYKNIFKEVPNKPSKKLVETIDREKFFRVVDNVYYLPPEDYVRQNLGCLKELDESFKKYYYGEVSKHLDWQNLNTRRVTTEIEALTFLQEMSQKEEIAVDIETTGLSLFDEELLLIVFAWGWNDVTTLEIFTPLILRNLEALFEKDNIKYIWHNGKFDITRLRTLSNVKARIDEDTMLLHYLTKNENRGTHGLGYLAQLYLDAPNWEKVLDKKKKEICKTRKIRQKDFNYGMFDKDDLAEYAFYDGIATYRLYKTFMEDFPEDVDFIYRKLIEASHIFSDIEVEGVYADIYTIEELETVLNEEYVRIISDIEKISKDIWDPEEYKRKTGSKTAPEKFNPNSPQQTKFILGKMGEKISDTSAKTLAKLDNDLAKQMLKLRKNNKYRRTYVKGLKESIETDGRIHTSFNLHGTATGRLSSSDPNLQNIPRDAKIKNIFTATPGKVLVQADYSQAELRVMAVLSGDKWLQDVYRRGEDLHDAVARQYWGDNFTSEDRTKAKAVNFGIAYGRTSSTLAPDLGISRREADKLLTDWFKPMGDVKKYFDKRVHSALQGNVAKTVFGRRRHFTVTTNNKFSIRNEAMNTPIQSTASDLTLFSLIEIQKELRAKNLGSIVLTVHDSIITETDPENVDEVAAIMKKHMVEIPKKYLNTDVPFVADIDVGTRWGEID